MTQEKLISYFNNGSVALSSAKDKPYNISSSPF